MGKYKRAFPNADEAKQKLFDKYLESFKIPGGGAINKIQQQAKYEQNKDSIAKQKKMIDVMRDKVIHTSGTTEYLLPLQANAIWFWFDRSHTLI